MLLSVSYDALILDLSQRPPKGHFPGLLAVGKWPFGCLWSYYESKRWLLTLWRDGQVDTSHGWYEMTLVDSELTLSELVETGSRTEDLWSRLSLSQSILSPAASFSKCYWQDQRPEIKTWGVAIILQPLFILRSVVLTAIGRIQLCGFSYGRKSL